MNVDRGVQDIIAIIGGTGREGKGLAFRLAKAGYRVIIGSRASARAEECALELNARCTFIHPLEGAENLEALQQASIIILAVPYSAHGETLSLIKPALQQRLLIDVTVPLVPPKVTRVSIPPEGSIGLLDQKILGTEASIATAFQNISFENLIGETAIDCDVLVCGSTKTAREETILLVEAAGMTAWDAGPLENSIVAEGLTSILIHLNKLYHSDRAGIKITGISRQN